jgi:hypothetical protein
VRKSTTNTIPVFRFGIPGADLREKGDSDDSDSGGFLSIKFYRGFNLTWE